MTHRNLARSKLRSSLALDVPFSLSCSSFLSRRLSASQMDFDPFAVLRCLRSLRIVLYTVARICGLQNLRYEGFLAWEIWSYNNSFDWFCWFWYRRWRIHPLDHSTTVEACGRLMFVTGAPLWFLFGTDGASRKGFE